MIKLLPVEYPPLTTNPSTAHSLSILWPRKEEIMPWFCGRFLQLVYADPVKMGFLLEELDENQISFPIDCPFVDTQYMDRRQMYSPPERYSDFIKYHLSQDSYVILSVDGYNLGHGYGKLKEHVLHQALVYGFWFMVLMMKGKSFFFRIFIWISTSRRKYRTVKWMKRKSIYRTMD